MDIQKKLEVLKKEYDKLYEDTYDMVMLDGEKIQDALKNQIPLEMTWELLCKKLNFLYDLCETEVESDYGDAVKAAMNDKFKELTFSEAKIYAKSDSSYKKSMAMLAEVRYVRDEVRGILEVVRSRRYVLHNTTSVLVAGVENHIL